MRNIVIYLEDEPELNDASPALSSVPIGADFQSLLDKASKSTRMWITTLYLEHEVHNYLQKSTNFIFLATGSSHFQFKSEKEWESLNTDEVKKV